MSLIILNDWHIGAIRSAGTTPTTAYGLRQDLLSQFEETLYGVHTDLMILGDLFDSHDISKQDLLRTYRILDDWLVRTGKDLWLVNGNHDLAKASTNFSSFQFLAKLLSEAGEGQYPGTVTHVEGTGVMTPYGYIIPHVTNQDLFDLELSKVPECRYLFVHCNYDNKFAVESDHSLNMSREQAVALPVKHIVFAHEHQGRENLGGKVQVIGNQFPSSVSDCLNNDTKRMMHIDLDGFSYIQTWKAFGDFAELDWRDLADTGARFIRVTGTASAGEAAQVVTAIAKFRSQSEALVITNAVVIEGQDNSEEINLTHEQITNFNVMDALLELLTEEEGTKIKTLMENRDAKKA